jgi:hypothetical protein
VQTPGAQAGEVLAGAPLDDGNVHPCQRQPASIIPVGPPPATTTACPAIRHPVPVGSGFGQRFCSTTPGLAASASRPNHRLGAAHGGD